MDLQVDELFNECVDEWIAGQVDKWTDGWGIVFMVEQMDG